LDDGSKWKIFPGDLDITLHWGPDTDVRVEQVEEEISFGFAFRSASLR
jgi:hypothetical protein